MELLKKLTGAFGPSGNEDDVAKIIEDEIRNYADEIRRDKLGNLIAVKKGGGHGRIMLAAHMDQIGILVLNIEKEGFLRFTSVGAVGPYTLLNQMVVFKNGVIGRITAEEEKDIKALKLKDLYIDIGASDYDEAVQLIPIGTFGVIKSDFVVKGTRVFSGALDNRIGCYTLVKTLKRMINPIADVYFAFTVQEETYMSGASTSAWSIEPDFAVAVDVTFAGDTPNGIKTVVKLGGGAGIAVMDDGLISHPSVKNLLIDTAKKHGIPYQFDIAKGATDGAEIHVSKSGVATGALTIPLRYMHTSCEVVDMKDVECTINLLTKVIEEYNL